MSNKGDVNKSLTGGSGANIIGSDLIPSLDNVFKIGITSLRWAIGYINNIVTTSLSAVNATISNIVTSSLSTVDASISNVLSVNMISPEISNITVTGNVIGDNNSHELGSSSVPFAKTHSIEVSTDKLTVLNPIGIFSSIELDGLLVPGGSNPSGLGERNNPFTSINAIYFNTNNIGPLEPFIYDDIMMTGNYIPFYNIQNTLGNSSNIWSAVYTLDLVVENLRAVGTNINVEAPLIPDIPKAHNVGSTSKPFGSLVGSTVRTNNLQSILGDIYVKSIIKPDVAFNHEIGTLTTPFNRIVGQNLNGDTLGNVSGLDITLFANVIPNSDNLYSLGNYDNRFSEVHAYRGCFMKLANSSVKVTATNTSFPTTNFSLEFPAVNSAPYRNGLANVINLPYLGTYMLQYTIDFYYGIASFPVYVTVVTADSYSLDPDDWVRLGEGYAQAETHLCHLTIIVINDIEENTQIKINVTQLLGVTVTAVESYFTLALINPCN